MIFGMTYYQILMYFIIYSIIGWVVEVIFHAVTLGKVINRGFLCGPVCPVYGFGMLTVLSVLNVISNQSGKDTNMIIVFFTSMILATLVELFAGWILDRMYNMRLWDYSEFPFNFHGYICLKFSIFWGLGGVIAVMVAHRSINSITVELIPEKIGWPILAFLYLGFLVDAIVTGACIQGFNKRLKEIDELRNALRMPSDKMTETIAGGSMKTAVVIERGRVQASLAEAELKDQVLEKKKRLTELSDRILFKNIVSRRILRAFPKLRHNQYTDLVKELIVRKKDT